jgi:hypothetical protein
MSSILCRYVSTTYHLGTQYVRALVLGNRLGRQDTWRGLHPQTFHLGLSGMTSHQTIEVDNKIKLAFTRHDPIGVCGQM